MSTNQPELESLLANRPDWSYWGKMHQLYLSELVPLSFDVTPCEALLVFGNVGGRMDYRFRDDRMHNRLSIVLSHLAGGSLRPSQTPIGTVFGAWRNIPLAVSTFGDWAVRLGLEIPTQFPRPHVVATEREQANGDQAREQSAPAQEDLLTGLTEEVKVIIEATKLARAERIHDAKSVRLLVERVAKQRLPYPLPGVALEQFAIAIRPDEAAHADPRSRKRPHGSPPKKPETRDSG